MKNKYRGHDIGTVNTQNLTKIGSKHKSDFVGSFCDPPQARRILVFSIRGD